MKKVQFCFCIHNHQPVGNFGWVIEDAFRKSYIPFLRTLEKYPKIKIALHFTGILFDWMKENSPDTIETINRLLKKGQLELLTGGYFEPIMPAIPDRDKVGQIRMQNDFLGEQFGVEPIGMWLAERVWEPHLPKVLQQAGVKYTILDDIHFRFSGLQERELRGYYLTEEEGHSLALFPIAKKLRYAIPFKDPKATIEYLQQLASDDRRNVAIYADDGEKFGVWPDTYKLCYTKGWLDNFFSLISENLDWIEMKFFSEILKEKKPLGRVYLPTASYSEMNEWAMPTDSIVKYESFLQKLKEENLLEENRNFIKGGFWRNFLSKYIESNNLHKRMLYVSKLLAEAKSNYRQTDFSNATRHLYAGQCNCPYWHGVFGGLYLPHLRGAVYQELIRAEAQIQKSTPGRIAKPEIEIVDFDSDGAEELLITTEKQKAIISPEIGGAIFEYDSFEVNRNLIDIVGRRKEGYHHKLTEVSDRVDETKSIHDQVIAKEEGLEQLLSPDWYRRGLFIDHFLGEDATLAEFARSRHPEDGDFVNQPYSYQYKYINDNLQLNLNRNGSIWYRGKQIPVQVTKTILFQPGSDRLIARYLVVNQHKQTIDLHLGIEFGFGGFCFPAGESTFRSDTGAALDPLVESEVYSGNQLEIESKPSNIHTGLKIDKKSDFWCHPLWTVSLSEGGFEKVYQGYIVLPHWRFQLQPGKSWEVEVIYFSNKIGANPMPEFKSVATGQA